MDDDPDRARRRRDAAIRENRRGLVRVAAALAIGGAIATLVIAGALTWMGQP